MKNSLSVVMITHNADELLNRVLDSVSTIANEIVVVDDGSTDRTLQIAADYNARVFTLKDPSLGKRKAFGIDQARGEWILVLDSDEIVSKPLAREIGTVIAKRHATDVYYIPYKNHFLGKPLRYGGERYSMPRLFKKKKATMRDSLVHEHIMFDVGRARCLSGTMLHYSYRSLPQMYKKFTDYALREARQKKHAGERTSVKKIVMYPPHMVWARFVKDNGYKDGFFRLPLDIGFGYMELVTYVSMLFIR